MPFDDYRRITMEQKTNVMRILDKAKIPYQAHNYTGTGAISGRR